jgi:membrane complex biogenesis BtpA family protein
MFQQIFFPVSKPVIGVIHLPPLLGYPEFTTTEATLALALKDLHSLQRGGVDGVIVENEYDHPHQFTVGPEIVASFTWIIHKVMAQATVPVGLEVLLNDWQASLAIAKACGAAFVRLDFFVDKVKVRDRVIEPNPAEISAYRQKIKAEHVALLTDIQVKYSELLEEKSLAVSARQAVTAGADAIIVTGRATGDMPALTDLQEAREAVGDFPVLVGSGATPANAARLFQYADGAIVGTALKSGSEPADRVVEDKVRQLMQVVRPTRS